jgi:hypothetical protein
LILLRRILVLQTELQMDIAFLALGAALFVAFGVYAALLKRV